MRSLLTLLLIILFSGIGHYAHAIDRDPIDTEHVFREFPNKLRKSIHNNLPKRPDFTTKAEINHYAIKNGLSLVDMKFELQLLARLSLDLSSKNNDRYTVARKLMDQLKLVEDSRFDKSYLLMLNGRYIGKTKQDFKSAINFYQQAITALSDEHSIKEQVLRFTLHEHLGVLHMMLRENEAALVHLNRAKAVAIEIAEPYMIAHAESVLGKYYYKKGQYGKSLSHYSEAIKHTKVDANPTQDAHIKMQLARVYRALKSWDDALRYATDASDIYQRLNNETYLAAAMTTIAMIYGDQEQWYKAIDYYLNAQQLDAKLGNYMGQALTLHNLGEAYFKIGDSQTSISHLLRANSIFSSRNSNHYLVYNHLLLAEVFSSIFDWEHALKYANSAADIAEEMKLNDEFIEALTLSSTALQHLGRFEQAYKKIKQINDLHLDTGVNDNNKEQAKTLLQLQKATLELNIKNNDLQRKEALLSTNRLVLIFCLLLLTLTSTLAIYLWRIKKVLRAKCAELTQKSNLDPLTQTVNHSAFIRDFTHDTNTFKTLALISLTEQLNSDLAQGYECNAKMNKQQIDSLINNLHCQVYLIRPGLFLLSFDIKIPPDTLLNNIRSALKDNYDDSSLHMGLLNLPLLADPALKLSAQQHFATLQMMLSAAITLGNQKDYYVTLKPRKFAYSAIFEPPLYLNIEKSIIRGIIKIETNGLKNDIIWPRWKSHQNVDLTTELS